jgi:uncharacterized protein
MKPRALDPRRLDVRALAKDQQRLDGRFRLDAMARLTGLLVGAAPEAEVVWQARGEERPAPGGNPEVWLELEARAELPLQCQRCLEPVLQAVVVHRWFRFARDEDEAARLDGETEDEVLVLTRELDLRQLVEDELLLDLPIVPRHERCAPPQAASAAADADADAHPFAALAGLRRDGR